METKSEADMDKQVPAAALSERVVGKLNARCLQAMLLTGAAYYMGAVVGFALTFAPQPISILWPSNAILLGVLLLAPLAWWPLLLVAVFFAHLLAEMQSGVPLPMMLGWFVSNCSEAIIGAAGTRLFLNGPLRFDSFRHVCIFLLVCVFFAPFLSSFIDIGAVRLLHWGEGSYWQLWCARFFANMMATLAFVPVLMTWSPHGARTGLSRITAKAWSGRFCCSHSVSPCWWPAIRETRLLRCCCTHRCRCCYGRLCGSIRSW